MTRRILEPTLAAELALAIEAGLVLVIEPEPKPPEPPPPTIEVPDLGPRVRGVEPHIRQLGPPKGNTSGSTRCLCGCGAMVSGSRGFKVGHGPGAGA